METESSEYYSHTMVLPNTLDKIGAEIIKIPRAGPSQPSNRRLYRHPVMHCYAVALSPAFPAAR
jgi:hypothetical protein